MIKASSLTGSGGALTLATDTNWPSTSMAAAVKGVPSVNFDPSAGLTNALDLTGKWAVSYLELFSLTNSENYTVRLIVDGVTRWDSTFAAAGNNYLLGTQNNAYPDVAITCNSSLQLQVQSSGDTSVSLRYKVRPIV